MSRPADEMGRYDEAVALRDGLTALEKNAAFAKLMEHIAGLAQQEAEAHEDKRKTPSERAEHIESMKLLRDLARWPWVEKARVLDAIKRMQSSPK